MSKFYKGVIATLVLLQVLTITALGSVIIEGNDTRRLVEIALDYQDTQDEIAEICGDQSAEIAELFSLQSEHMTLMTEGFTLINSELKTLEDRGYKHLQIAKDGIEISWADIERVEGRLEQLAKISMEGVIRNSERLDVFE
jgi:hypothetical protein